MITNIFKDNIWLYLLFLFIPILNVYSFGVGNIALIALLVVAIYGLISGNVFKKQKLFLFLGFLVIFHETIFYVMYNVPKTSGTWFNRIVEELLFVISIATFVNVFDLGKLYKWWRLVGVLFMIGLFYHSIEYYVFNHNVDMIKLPFLPLSDNKVFEKILTVDYTRPRSFFTEPSHYASFMLPLLFLNLLYKDYKYGAINMVFLLLSTSSLGIVTGVFFLIVMSFKHTSFKIKLLLIIFLIIGYFCFLNMDIFQYARDKIATSNGGDESSSLRLFFTASVWAELPVDLKILGIPNFSIGDFLLQNSKYIPNQLVWVLQDESSINYASSIWFVAVKFGLVVWIVYLFFYIRNIQKSWSSPILYYALMIFVATFIQSCFLNSIFMSQIVLMLVLLNNKKYIDEKYNCNNVIRK